MSSSDQRSTSLRGQCRSMPWKPGVVSVAGGKGSRATHCLTAGLSPRHCALPCPGQLRLPLQLAAAAAGHPPGPVAVPPDPRPAEVRVAQAGHPIQPLHCGNPNGSIPRSDPPMSEWVHTEENLVLQPTPYISMMKIKAPNRNSFAPSKPSNRLSRFSSAFLDSKFPPQLL